MRRRLRIPWLLIFTILVFVFLFAPIILVVLFSFNKTASLTFPFHGFTLRWYRTVLASPTFMSAIWASVRVGLVTVALTVTIGTLAALAVTRYSFPGRRVLRTFLLLPAALPGLFMGMALLSLFSVAQVRLSLWTVTAGHLVYVLPYFFLVASTRLDRFDFLLEESARDLGAGPWTTLSWDEVMITYFTIGNENTLPLVIYSTVKQSIDPSVNAVSTLLLLGSLIFLVGARRFVADLQQ
jgi:spermidine/putrescine transport system permease protein